MTAQPPVQLSRLRDIGWQLWNPIGLRPAVGAEDEYDAYLLQVVSRLRRGQLDGEVVNYLIHIETVHMGLEPNPSTRDRAVATVKAVRDYLSGFPEAR